MEGGPFDVESAGDRAPAPPPGAPGTPRPRRRESAEPPRHPPPSETLTRIAWVVPWIAAVIALIVVGGLAFAVAMAALACIGLIELFRMTRDAAPFAPVAFVIAAAMTAAAYWGDHFQIVLVGACAFPLMFVAAASRQSRARVTVSIAITLFGIAWIAVPFAHAVLLRELPSHGAGLLVDVLVATFVADTAAYAGGRLFGRRPLAPSLSPNKTVEGLAFGFVGGTLGFWFAGLYQDWLPGIDALLMGMAVAAIAPLGDLFESLVKRDLGIKDSGNLFGPHGGLLDRIDAVLFTVVVGYYLAVAFLY